MNDAAKEAIKSAVRSCVIALGAWAAGRDLVDDETASAIAGSLMVIVPLVWGVLNKFFAEQKTAAREVTAVKAGVAAGAAGAEIPASVTPETAPVILKAFAPPTNLGA